MGSLHVALVCILSVWNSLVPSINGVPVADTLGPPGWRRSAENQQARQGVPASTLCNRLERLTAQEPRLRYDFEAGMSEFWDTNDNQLGCAGVTMVRTVIQPRGLYMPHFIAAPQLFFVVQGTGVQGTIIPGCPDAFQSARGSPGDPRTGSPDFHQKVLRFREGDLLALPAGVTLWYYNDGTRPIIALSLLDSNNEVNQLDETFRVFFLAGNPRITPQSFGTPLERVRNVLTGLSDSILARSFNVNSWLAWRMKGEGDNRGRIVLADGFDVLIPQQEQRPNTAEEEQNAATWSDICRLKLMENLVPQAQPDIFTAQGGFINVINRLKLPILSLLGLSAERGFLLRGAILSPQWIKNAHTIFYITRGNARIQIITNSGMTMFDSIIRQEQLIVVPQYFVFAMEAGDQGCEWVAFKTSDYPVASPIAGRQSVIRGMPETVVMHSYRLSRDEARSLKYNTRDFLVLRADSWGIPRGPGGGGATTALNVTYM